MKASDTVMSQEEINAMDWTGDVGHLCSAVAKAQAEISFKAGIKEVVDFIEGESEIHNVHEAGCLCLCIYLLAWKAKLKDWGL